MSSMSFAQTYILASKVRTKLTKDASNPRSSLRNLVVQANMLDNLMDHIADESSKRLENLNQKSNTVKFNLPSKPKMQVQPQPSGTSIVEYEVDSDESDEYESDSDSDYYYSSEDEDYEEEEFESAQEVEFKNFKMPTIQEEADHHDIPELTKSISLTDSEDEEDDMVSNYVLTTKSSGLDAIPKTMKETHSESLFGHQHQRKNAVFTIQEMF